MGVIGIGTSSQATLEDILHVIAAAKATARQPLKVLATLDRPALNKVISEASELEKMRLFLLSLSELKAVADGCVTHSEKSMQCYGVPSIAEAAALAAAGAGARLLLPRFGGRNTTASVAIVP